MLTADKQKNINETSYRFWEVGSKTETSEYCIDEDKITHRHRENILKLESFFDVSNICDKEYALKSNKQNQ